MSGKANMVSSIPQGMTQPRFIILVTLLLAGMGGLYLLGNESVPLWDRDEPRYAQCSREMLMGSPEHPGSDFVVPRFLGELRLAKPPMVYWLQAGSMAVLGDTAFAARFPSTVAMLAVLSIVALTVRRATDADRALWTAFILATSVLTFAAAKSSLTDAVLLAFTCVAQACVFVIWQGRGCWGTFALLGTAIGLAGLTKGPITVAIVAATLAALGLLRAIDWWRARRDPASVQASADVGRHGTSVGLGRLIGYMAKALLAIGLVAAIVGPWIYLVEQRSPGFIRASWSTNVVDRIRRGAEGHSGPPGYYAATIWGTYFPWSIFIPMALVFAWKGRRDPRVRFALSATLGPWIMLECVRTKLPHYFLPALPFLAFLTANAFVGFFRGEHDVLARPALARFMRSWGVVVALLASLPWLMALRFQPQPWLALAVVSLVGTAYGATVGVLFMRGRPHAGLVTMGVGMAALAATLFTFFLPQAQYLRTSINVAAILKQHGATGAGEVVMQSYKEPSLAFYQGGTIRERSANAIDPQTLPPWLVTTRVIYDRTPQPVQRQFEVVGSVHGLNYAGGGRAVEVMVLHKRSPPK
jgi:hypothetical protein